MYQKVNDNYDTYHNWILYHMRLLEPLFDRFTKCVAESVPFDTCSLSDTTDKNSYLSLKYTQWVKTPLIEEVIETY